MKKILLIFCVLLYSGSMWAQEEYVANLSLQKSQLIKINFSDKPVFVFLANMQDTLYPITKESDTLTYFTRLGIVKIKWEDKSAQLHYYYSGIWTKTPLYPVGNSEKLQDNFYKDESGNIAWLKWSKSRNLPLLYSPYRKYRSYLIPISEDEYLNSNGDKITLSDQKMIYEVEGSMERMELQPFEAYQREEVFVSTHGDSLFGYLYRPVGKSNTPVCLLLQGGGSVGIENYLLEAEFLAAHGIATAIFNKSGEERSRGKTNFRQQSFNEKLDEYADLFEWLISQEGINPHKAGLHGMSEGGRLTVDLAARLEKPVSYIISVSGPFSSFSDNQLYAINRYLHQALWPDTAVATATNVWARYYQEVLKDSISTGIQNEINKLRSLHPRLYLPPAGNTPPTDWRKEDVNFHSLNSLKNVEAPILFQLAELDARVDVHRTAASINQLRNNPLDWMRFYPETVHGMTDSRGNITSGFLYDKIEWLKTIGIIE